MMRFFLWMFVIVIAWRLIEALLSPKKNARNKPPAPNQSKTSSSAFSNIEEADFEDITPKSPPPESTTS